MPKGYRHLTCAQRCQITVLLHRGLKKKTIATMLGVHRSTITRELQRNRSSPQYKHEYAQQQADIRRHLASSAPTSLTQQMKGIISFLLHTHQWSPEQISGWLRRCTTKRVSHESIYRFVWKDKQQGGLLYQHLRHGGKKYNHRKGKTSGRGCIPHRVDIALRPGIVERKVRLGDWEADTIIGNKHKGALLSCVDRVSKVSVLVKLPNTVAHGLRRIKSAGWPVHTLTFDNGKEFAGHKAIGAMLGADTFFATPYRSWERGLNEHTNGLVRQYFPKGCDFQNLTHEAVQMVENTLNLRPRKVLGFQSPLEFAEAMMSRPCVALQG